jgi:hypothetical protein
MTFQLCGDFIITDEAQGLWAGSHCYYVTTAFTRGLVLSDRIQRTTPFSQLLRHTRGRDVGDLFES